MDDGSVLAEALLGLEGFRVLEAFAARLPVAATDVGGVQRVAARAALLMRPGKSATAAENVRRLAPTPPCATASSKQAPSGWRAHPRGRAAPSRCMDAQRNLRIRLSECAERRRI